MAFIYENARRQRMRAIEQAIPISLVRRCFILAVVASACPDIEVFDQDNAPKFEDVAGQADLRIHNTLLEWERKPLAYLPPNKATIAHDEVLLLREKVMRPYGKMTIFSACVVCIAILQWLIDNDLFSLDDKPELLGVLEEVRVGVRDIDTRQWDTLEKGSKRTATFILAALAAEGFGFGVTEQQWREAFDA